MFRRQVRTEQPPTNEQPGLAKRAAYVILVRFLPVWVLLLFAAWVLAPSLTLILRAWLFQYPYLDGRYPANGEVEIAPLFTPQVHYWTEEILRWGSEYEINPNLIATIIQIESCGNPNVTSPAGAQGLLQVMPYHFEAGEDMLEPDSNASRGLGVLKGCLERTNYRADAAMACYNGGPGVLDMAQSDWPAETRSYVTWGRGIYADALAGRSESPTLNAWLEAGGEHLCTIASMTLGLAQTLSSPME